MRINYNWLVAGMLAVASAAPVFRLQASTPAARPLQICMTLTGAMAYRILEEAIGPLEAQMELSLSVDFLMSEYHGGKLDISYLGYDGIVHVFQVAYGGGTLITSIEEI